RHISTSTLFPYTTLFRSLVKVSNNLFALPAGNGNYDNVINILDYKCVVDEMETKGYKIGDYDLNGIVNNSDYAKTANNLFKLSRSEEHTSELQSRENLVC